MPDPVQIVVFDSSEPLHVDRSTTFVANCKKGLVVLPPGEGNASGVLCSVTGKKVELTVDFCRSQCEHRAN